MAITQSTPFITLGGPPQKHKPFREFNGLQQLYIDFGCKNNVKLAKGTSRVLLPNLPNDELELWKTGQSKYEEDSPFELCIQDD